MILETAMMKIAPGHEDAFESAVDEARGVLSQASGFRALRVHRGVERHDTYLLAIKWDSVEDHLVGFREGPLFAQWRALLAPHFAEPPHVEHWELLD